jgi:hypothetical protein
MRNRTITTQPVGGGAICPDLVGTQVCNLQTCPPSAFGRRRLTGAGQRQVWSPPLGGFGCSDNFVALGGMSMAKCKEACEAHHGCVEASIIDGKNCRIAKDVTGCQKVPASALPPSWHATSSAPTWSAHELGKKCTNKNEKLKSSTDESDAKAICENTSGCAGIQKDFQGVWKVCLSTNTVAFAQGTVTWLGPKCVAKDGVVAEESSRVEPSAVSTLHACKTHCFTDKPLRNATTATTRAKCSAFHWKDNTCTLLKVASAVAGGCDVYTPEPRALSTSTYVKISAWAPAAMNAGCTWNYGTRVANTSASDVANTAACKLTCESTAGCHQISITEAGACRYALDHKGCALTTVHGTSGYMLGLAADSCAPDDKTDCGLSMWGAWGTCTAKCGGGKRSRYRSVATPSHCGGDACGLLVDVMACNSQTCGVDCKVGTWSQWGNCSTACGGSPWAGRATRTRSVLVNAANGGLPCPVATDIQVCNQKECPHEDCQVGAWGNWTVCPGYCGAASELKGAGVNGIQMRYRPVLQSATGSGRCSLSNKEKRVCTPPSCPTDCMVGVWSPWSACSKNCGGGMRNQTRAIITPALSGGVTCPTTFRGEACNMVPCAKDCIVSKWTALGKCSSVCGSGTTRRVRSVLQSAGYGGMSCPMLVDEQECNNHACPINCKVGSFDVWGQCSASCGGGNMVRHREITVVPHHGGAECPQLTDTQECSRTICPQNCVVSDWTDVGSCSKSCDGGSQLRYRTVVTPVGFDGMSCPPLLDTNECNTAACVSACTVAAWSPFGICTKKCGGGTTTSTRLITGSASTHAAGLQCSALTRTQDCNTQSCLPVCTAEDCSLAAWGSWGMCSHKCGSGTQHRRRLVLSSQQCAGVACAGLSETRNCHSHPCPVHCQISAWSDWTPCSLSCGFGESTRTREITTSAAYGGDACPNLVQSAACNTHACPVDCTTSPWSPWSECSKLCATGTQFRTRFLMGQALYGGSCVPTFETQQCNVHQCPVNCVVSGWSAFGACAKTCGGGFQSRTRSVVSVATHGGSCHGALSASTSCNTHACPVDCVVSQWSSFSPCSAACGIAHKTRTRTVITPPANGAVCPVMEDVQPCLGSPSCETACTGPEHNIDCIMGAWSMWSSCSAQCGGGFRQRTRSTMVPAACTGAPCGVAIVSEPCNQHACPIGCTVSLWGSWGTCTASCAVGGQSRHRTRDVLSQPQFGGALCPSLLQSEPCNANVVCGVDCVMGSWGSYGSCSTTCGVGTHMRSRQVLVQPVGNGIACPSTAGFSLCTHGACGQDCVVSSWGSYGTCDKSCGSGSQTRARTILMGSANGGAACPTLQGQRACNTGCCPVSCVLSPWGTWSQCSKTCGLGDKTRARTITTHPSCGGDDCLTQDDRDTCVSGGLHDCPVDCVLGQWAGWGMCNVNCGGGVHTRTRPVVTSANYGGKACEDQSETESCNAHTCPPCPLNGSADVSCAVSTWSDWSTCTAGCNTGTQVRTRDITTPTMCGGSVCPALEESRNCNTQPCAEHCVPSLWGSWGACTLSCGSGSTSRTRSIISPSRYGGLPCGQLEESHDCNESCCPSDCVVSQWSTWGTVCSKVCTDANGSGTRTRTRDIESHAHCGGTPCPGGVDGLVGSQDCNTHPCPVDCAHTAWGAWSACSTTCGLHASRTRTRSITQQPLFSGVGCGTLVDSDTCPDQIECPEPCVVTGWGGWGACSKTCGAGTHTRTRTVHTPAKFGGECNDDLMMTQACEDRPCPIHCEVAAWSGYGNCTTPCGPGIRTRTRGIVVHAQHGGLTDQCNTLTEDVACNEQVCALDCIHEFTLWTECSKTCGTGHQSRDVVVKQPPAGDGLPCPTSESRLCNTFVCASPHPTAAPTPLATLAPTPSPSPGPIVYPPPILTLTGGDDHLFLEADPTSVYTDAGATCSDTTEGDISEAVIVSGADYPDYTAPAAYTICYNCKNKHGSSATELCRTIAVRDTTCPVCTINAGPEVVEASFPYTDTGAKCTDSLHPGVELAVVVQSSVNTEVVGDYQVIYRAQDVAGNFNDGSCQGSAVYSRTVKVVDTLKPVIGLHLDGKLVHHGAGGVSDSGTGALSNPSEQYYKDMLSQEAALMAEQHTSATDSAWMAAGILAVVAGVALLAATKRR